MNYEEHIQENNRIAKKNAKIEKKRQRRIKRELFFAKIKYKFMSKKR